jgi:hypothetical protein
MSTYLNVTTVFINLQSKEDCLSIFEDLRFHYNRLQSKYVHFHHSPDLETDIIALDNELAQYYAQLDKVAKVLMCKHGIIKFGSKASIITNMKYPRL